MDETGTIATTASGSAAPAPGWLGFGLGLVVLAGDTLRSVLALSGAPDSPPGVADADAAGARLSPRHAVWGLLVDLLDRARRRGPTLLRACRVRAARVARRLAPSIARGRRLARHLPGGAHAAARWHAWRGRRRAQLAAWAATGQREEAASRAVARKALTALRERALARVADSPDVKRVIREQSEGIAVTAVNELRNRSARADRLAERAVRRLLGRGETDGAG